MWWQRLFRRNLANAHENDGDMESEYSLNTDFRAGDSPFVGGIRDERGGTALTRDA